MKRPSPPTARGLLLAAAWTALSTAGCTASPRAPQSSLHPGDLGLSFDEAAILSVDTTGVAEGILQLEARIREAVNGLRARSGLVPVEHHDRLAAIARAHSTAMAAGLRSVGHDGWERRASAAERAKPFWQIGENVLSLAGRRTDIARSVLHGWTGSPSHRRTMHGRFSHTGVGVAYDAEGALYVTQLFVLAR